MQVIHDDRVAHFAWLEHEGLLYCNTDTWMPCPGSYGFVSDLPETSAGGKSARLADCWGWVESQESEPISPKMFNDFFLPYIADVTRPFGLVYWGCCERVDDRFPYIEKAIPNLRAVSVSGSSIPVAYGRDARKEVRVSRSRPQPMSRARTPTGRWPRRICATPSDRARDCNLEICFRDSTRIGGDRPRLAQWVKMVRAMMNG